jgi:hypothetical protein
MEQKDLFEASAHRLPYVECSPNGRQAPLASVCIFNNVKSFPTWVVDGRMHEGVLKPDRLAVLSGYPGNK